MDAVATSHTTGSAPPRRSFAGAFVAPVAVTLVVIGCWLTKPAPAPTLGPVASFSLTERSGRPLDRSELAGHPWVADFIFTRCGGPCPRLSEAMTALQSKLGRSDARLVSFTVDPEHDTPEVLSAYAKAHAAGERWSFLTGSAAAITSLVQDSFHLPMARGGADVPAEAAVSHSTRLALVDRAGMIRGYYDGVDENMNVNQAELGRLDHDLRALGSGSRLPFVNACLNATSAFFLIVGFAFIRAGRERAHAASMLTALAVSAVFLGFYLYYHALYPDTPYSGPTRALYFTILISHVSLAVPVVVLALGTAILGLRGSFARHRKWARVAFPLWVYVCVTGVAVYALLYEIHG